MKTAFCYLSATPIKCLLPSESRHVDGFKQNWVKFWSSTCPAAAHLPFLIPSVYSSLSIIMVFLWNVTRVFLSSSNYAAPISFGRVQLYVGPDKREGSKKVLHTGERTQPNQPTQHTDTEFQGARGAGGIKSCSSARTLVPSRQFKTGQTNSLILVSNKKKLHNNKTFQQTADTWRNS